MCVSEVLARFVGCVSTGLLQTWIRAVVHFTHTHTPAAAALWRCETCSPHIQWTSHIVSVDFWNDSFSRLLTSVVYNTLKVSWKPWWDTKSCKWVLVNVNPNPPPCPQQKVWDCTAVWADNRKAWRLSEKCILMASTLWCGLTLFTAYMIQVWFYSSPISFLFLTFKKYILQSWWDLSAIRQHVIYVAKYKLLHEFTFSSAVFQKHLQSYLWWCVLC